MNRENRKEKDLKNTYLYIAREMAYGEEFEENLLYKQRISGLLKFYEVQENGEAFLVYELNHRMSCLEQMNGKRMDCQWMSDFIYSLIHVMESMDEYLLDPSNLVLEMAYIFCRDGLWEYVYIPGYGEDFWAQMGKLGEEWLNYVDYKDEKAVLWAYTFYQKVHNDRCSIEDLAEILQMPEKKKEEEKRAQTEFFEEPKVKPGWRERMKQELFGKIEMLRKQLNHKRHIKADADFYSEAHTLGNTSPVLEGLSDFLSIPAYPENKQLILIPVGNNEFPVISVNKFPFLFGRAPDEVDCYFERNQISRIHARIESRGNEVLVVDMNSANGTFRNEEKLKPGTEYALHTGDMLKLADMEFICQ